MRSQTLLNLLAFVVKFAVALVQYPFTLIVLRAPIGAAVYADADEEEADVVKVDIVKDAESVPVYSAIQDGQSVPESGGDDEQTDSAVRMDSYRPPTMSRQTAALD